MRLPILAVTASAMALALAGPAGAMSHGGDKAEKAAEQTGAETGTETEQAGAQAQEGQDDVQIAFSRFDIDMDGSLDAKELAFAHFAALDDDSNGILTEDEYQETFLIRMDTVPDRTWTFADVDGDGNAEITDIEFVEAFTAAEVMPPGLDTDDDQRITLAEFADAAGTGAVSMTRGQDRGQEGQQQQAQTPDDAPQDAIDEPVTGLMFEGGDTDPQAAEQENLTGATSPPTD